LESYEILGITSVAVRNYSFLKKDSAPSRQFVCLFLFDANVFGTPTSREEGKPEIYAHLNLENQNRKREI
jgi:hypothetical protein